MWESPKKKVMSLGESKKEKSLSASVEVSVGVVARFFGVEDREPDAPFTSGEYLARLFPLALVGVRAVFGELVGAFWSAGVHSSSRGCLDSEYPGGGTPGTGVV